MIKSTVWQPSPEQRERIRKAVTDLTEAREIPLERFPGHKATYCANLEGWLGGFTLALLNALEEVESERDRLRSFVDWVAGHQLVPGFYAGVIHPYDEWITPEQDEMDFNDVHEHAVEALSDPVIDKSDAR